MSPHNVGGGAATSQGLRTAPESGRGGDQGVSQSCWGVQPCPRLDLGLLASRPVRVHF